MAGELSDAERDSMIQQFCSVTAVSPNEVTLALLFSEEPSSWNFNRVNKLDV